MATSSGSHSDLVTLHDGRVVASDSEEWRHECEAMAIIAMPALVERRQYLYGKRDPITGEMKGGVLQRRGQAALAQIEKTIRALWYASRKHSSSEGAS